MIERNIKNSLLLCGNDLSQINATFGKIYHFLVIDIISRNSFPFTPQRFIIRISSLSWVLEEFPKCTVSLVAFKVAPPDVQILGVGWEYGNLLSFTVLKSLSKPLLNQWVWDSVGGALSLLTLAGCEMFCNLVKLLLKYWLLDGSIYMMETRELSSTPICVFSEIWFTTFHRLKSWFSHLLVIPVVLVT